MLCDHRFINFIVLHSCKICELLQLYSILILQVFVFPIASLAGIRDNCTCLQNALGKTRSSGKWQKVRCMFRVALTSLSLLLSLLTENILFLHSCLQIQSTAGGPRPLRFFFFFSFSLCDAILITLKKASPLCQLVGSSDSAR